MRTIWQNFFFPCDSTERATSCLQSSFFHPYGLHTSYLEHDKYLLMRKKNVTPNDLQQEPKVWKMSTRRKIVSFPALTVSPFCWMRLHDGPWEASAESLPRSLRNRWVCTLGHIYALITFISCTVCSGFLLLIHQPDQVYYCDSLTI